MSIEPFLVINKRSALVELNAVSAIFEWLGSTCTCTCTCRTPDQRTKGIKTLCASKLRSRLPHDNHYYGPCIMGCYSHINALRSITRQYRICHHTHTYTVCRDLAAAKWKSLTVATTVTVMHCDSVDDVIIYHRWSLNDRSKESANCCISATVNKNSILLILIIAMH